MSNPNRSPRPRLTTRGKAVVSVGLLGLGVVGGVAGKNIYDEATANSNQPGCDITVKPNDTLSGIINTVAKKEDLGLIGDVTVLDDAGHDRGVIRPESLHPDDQVVIGNVDPRVCQQLGGTVVTGQVDLARIDR